MSDKKLILSALRAAQSALNQMPNTRLTGEHSSSYAVAALVDLAVVEAQTQTQRIEDIEGALDDALSLLVDLMGSDGDENPDLERFNTLLRKGRE